MPKISIPAPNPPMVTAKHMGGSQTPGLIVMHSTVGPTKTGSAAAIAHMFSVEALATSAHYCVDESAVFQCVPDHRIAFHCGYNTNSIGIEMCDMPVLNSADHWWIPKGKRQIFRKDHHTKVNPIRWVEPQHRAMLNHAARLTAQLCLAYGIPIRLLSNAQLKAWAERGKRAEDGGIVTHAQMTAVFQESTHWDPGKWPKNLFIKRVQHYADLIKSKG